MAAIVILGYELFITYYVGNKGVDFELCKRILDEQLSIYPNGYFFRFFKGKYHMIKVRCTPFRPFQTHKKQVF